MTKLETRHPVPLTANARLAALALTAILALTLLFAAKAAASVGMHPHGRDGIRLGSGRHVLAVRAHRGGRTVTSTHQIHVTQPSSGSTTSSPVVTSGSPSTTKSTPAPVVTPAPTPVVTPTPEPTPTPTPTPEPTPTPAPAPLLEANFENGLQNWNISGVGETVPTIESSNVRTGTHAGRFLLSGNQNRSELVLGGNGTASTGGTAEFHEGDEYWYGFSFNIQQMVYGKPGGHNLIMQFKSDGEGSPLFGLQLWNVNGEKGLWSAGTAMKIGSGGERFLAPAAEHAWHDVQIHFKASEVGQGFYEVFLDGKLIDSRSNVTMMVPGTHEAYIKDGIYRNGETVAGTSEVLIDSAKLGKSQASVLPG